MNDTVRPLDGKVAIVTGATSGIGAVVARELGARGAQLAIVGRDAARLESSIADLTGRGISVRGFRADLGDTRAVRALVVDLRAAYPRVDVLVNNAGGIFYRFERTPSGDERTLAVNVLAPFLLTEGLLPSLTASGAGRVVNVASTAHKAGRIDRTDLDHARDYGGWKAYSQSKVALILLTAEAARRHAASPVTFNSCHPGFVRSRFGHGDGGFNAAMIRFLQSFAAISPERGAETPLYLATSPEVARVSGAYYVRCAPHRPSAKASDPATASWLWSECERRTSSAPSAP